MDLIAYHGTDFKNIESIIKDGYVSSSEEEWFGRGVYFFETLNSVVDGAVEAENWMKYVKRQKEWAIFEASIVSDNYIDLLENVEHRLLYDQIRKEALNLHLESGYKICVKKYECIKDNRLYKTNERGI